MAYSHNGNTIGSTDGIGSLCVSLAGTPLGDPIEVGAASAVFFPATRRRGDRAAASSSSSERGRGQDLVPFVWSTIKGFGGHQEAAAGDHMHGEMHGERHGEMRGEMHGEPYLKRSMGHH